MNFPRREIASIREPLMLRLNANAFVGATNLGRRISAATIVRPRTTRRNERTTCSTSGSSGMSGATKRRRAAWFVSDNSHQQQDQHDYHQQTNASTGSVSPVPA